LANTKSFFLRQNRDFVYSSIETEVDIRGQTFFFVRKFPLILGKQTPLLVEKNKYFFLFIHLGCGDSDSDHLSRRRRRKNLPKKEKTKQEWHSQEPWINARLAIRLCILSICYLLMVKLFINPALNAVIAKGLLWYVSNLLL
jgi:hypothetical protein